MSQSARRRKRGGEHEDAERWLLTYADMITLLMAFFIMLYAMSVVNMGKFNKLAVSVRSGFGGNSKGMYASAPGFRAQRGNAPIQPPLTAFDLMATVARQVAGGVSPQVQAHIQFLSEEGMVRIRIEADDVLFPRGSAMLTSEAKQTLAAVGDAVQGLPYLLRVEGHTCDLPIHTPQFASNWELSSQRAINVVLFFVREAGFSPSSMSAVGYADTVPVAPNTSEAERKRNRRIDIALIREQHGRRIEALGSVAAPEKPDITPEKIQIVPSRDPETDLPGKGAADDA